MPSPYPTFRIRPVFPPMLNPNLTTADMAELLEMYNRQYRVCEKMVRRLITPEQADATIAQIKAEYSTILRKVHFSQ